MRTNNEYAWFRAAGRSYQLAVRWARNPGDSRRKCWEAYGKDIEETSYNDDGEEAMEALIRKLQRKGEQEEARRMK